MRNKSMTILVYIIIGLAAVGLFSQLFGNTISFLSRILVTIVIGAAIFGLLYYFFVRRNSPTNTEDRKKYKQAVKQSKTKYNSTSSPIPKKATHKKKRTKKASHLRVIEGSKSKKKNRASY
ncbi:MULTISPECIES: SA1362 family protein [Oceanobacillus]|uniref:Uncharacterized protein n=1 Tax=Oceanobacillus kimchii TaxID=746691 RepID=A0ABQ5TPM1_9BACI|nr:MULTISPECIES: SA1362 family protein [Oceanobacillus]MBT2598350.1 hypothetical protein [Oceanobacillus sp. ISL-74]MBT2651268.1 hypothetical protein [Oceanobacillus sp. ISL-73]MCT1575927.1 DUF378 domain-containing protein [Oceanobacillus kimchii]MCT2135564.1 DUF378 domain-containing protein [Oceanobacillus kimchii]OEH55667.1 hypothetical protein AQ616_05685 [Oceanobacillus sp. E9]